ncbi:NAD+ synthase [Natranaeroarchaeum aerophilus]|uniref:NH(3)-dependent NAD(+) synthetase n=1 Tax=Natranaeroarchaeum aerophilus TaxID=2917711 RepID=A0AAE3FRI3_9EURY|nr:NAD+ synthase [Natranaeroarchaeum aerophilus]MCL9813513.1 NAD+ synthase [Natranaeroarchaeum aerophilus]
MLSGDDTTFERYLGESEGPTFLTTGEGLDAVRAEIVEFIRRTVVDANADGVVVAMSGGIDSTLTAALAVEALGSDRVLGLGLPASKTDSVHAREARTIADGLGIEFHEIQLRPLLEAFEETVGTEIGEDADRVATGNVLARLRMLCAYYAANTRSLLVAGTSNRSELLLGYNTKYGDGAADLFPIGDLYKTEVRSLAPRVGVPRRIVSKPPTGGLWSGQTDETELGAEYRTLDRLLRLLVDREYDIEAAAERVDVPVETAEDVATMYLDAAHKRTLPPMPGIGERNADRSRQPFYR